MKVSINWKAGLLFEGLAGNYTFTISAPQPSLDKKAVSPHELLLFSLASSCGVEIVSKIEKTKSLNHFEVVATATHDPKKHELFSAIDLHFNFEGDCSKTEILNAVEFSQYQSRSIGYLLSKILPIRWKISINDDVFAEGIANYYDLESQNRNFQ